MEDERRGHRWQSLGFPDMADLLRVIRKSSVDTLAWAPTGQKALKARLVCRLHMKLDHGLESDP